LHESIFIPARRWIYFHADRLVEVHFYSGAFAAESIFMRDVDGALIRLVASRALDS